MQRNGSDLFEDEEGVFHVTRAELEELFGDISDWQRDEVYRHSKADRYRPWPNEPVLNVPPDGHVNKNLPVRRAFPVKPPPKPKIMTGWAPSYALHASTARKRVSARFRGPWKTRR